MSERVLLFTPRLRLLGLALQSVYAMRQAYGRPLAALETQHAHVGEPAEDAVTRRETGGNHAILAQYQQARAAALAGDYTHLLTIEDDMVVPLDTLDRLLACRAGVAYGIYCWRWGEHRWNAYRYVWEDSGESWSVDAPHIAAQHLSERRRVPVQGLGLGCTLIRADVLERIPFRLPPDAPAANDWYFARDCQAADIDQVADFGVVCGHQMMSPSARIIWPHVGPDDRATYRYEYLEVAIP